jgi:hypothetical protein
MGKPEGERLKARVQAFTALSRSEGLHVLEHVKGHLRVVADHGFVFDPLQRGQLQTTSGGGS